MPETELETAGGVSSGEASRAEGEAAAARAAIQLGLVATPALTEAATAELAAELVKLLSERYPGVRWEVAQVRDPLVTPPVELTELVDAARGRLLHEGWDLAVWVTDLPLRVGRRPILTHASPTHGVALVSLPAHGVRNLGRRLRDSIADAVGILVGDTPSRREQDQGAARRSGVQRRLVELATDAEDSSDGQGVAFLARVITGNIQLLLGMIRANQPWRLVGRLSRALLAAVAAASFALVSDDVWRIAVALDDVRLIALTLGSIAIAVVTLITAHGLWERAEDQRVREQVALFNLVTAITVTFGIASLYAVVLIVSLCAAAILIDSSLFAQAVRHPVDISDYLRLAWLASSLATVGGALGGVLESDETVREAAYAYRSDAEVAPLAREGEPATAQRGDTDPDG